MSWKFIGVRNDDVWAGAHVYHSAGPMICLTLQSEDSKTEIYIRLGQAVRFAFGILRICSYGLFFKIGLIVRDLW
jgi:hypothetical protein